MRKSQQDSRSTASFIQSLDGMMSVEEMRKALGRVEEGDDDDDDDDVDTPESCADRILDLINLEGVRQNIQFSFEQNIPNNFIETVRKQLEEGSENVFKVSLKKRLIKMLATNETNAPIHQSYHIMSNEGKIIIENANARATATNKKKQDELRMPMLQSGLDLITAQTEAAAAAAAPAMNPLSSPKAFYETFKQHLDTTGLEVSLQSHAAIPPELVKLTLSLANVGIEGKTWAINNLTERKAIQLFRADHLIAGQLLRPYCVEYRGGTFITLVAPNLQQNQQISPPVAAATTSANGAAAMAAAASTVNPTSSPEAFYKTFKQHLDTIGLEISCQSHATIPRGLLDLIQPLLKQGIEGKKWAPKIIPARKVLQLCRTDLMAQFRPYCVEYGSGTFITPAPNLQQGQQNSPPVAAAAAASANGAAAMTDDVASGSGVPTAAAVAAAYAAATAAAPTAPAAVTMMAPITPASNLQLRQQNSPIVAAAAAVIANSSAAMTDEVPSGAPTAAALEAAYAAAIAVPMSTAIAPAAITAMAPTAVTTTASTASAITAGNSKRNYHKGRRRR